MSVLVALALSPRPEERSPRIHPAVAGLLMAYLALNLIAFAFSTDHGRSLFGERLQYQGVITLLIYAGALVAGAQTARSRSTTALLFWVVAAGGTAVSAYALAQMLDLDPIEWAYGAGPPERAFSSIGQANALAAYLVLVVPIALILLDRTDGRSRWALVTAIALMIVAIALTYSRAGYLALGVVVLIVGVPFVLRAGWRSSVVAGLAGCAVLSAAALTVPSLDNAGERVFDRAGSVSDQTDVSVQKRIGMWTVAAQITADNPLIGTGQETYPEMFSRYRDYDLPGFGTAPARPESPHNNYLAISSSAGVPALAAYLAVIGGVMWLLLRSRVPRHTRFALTAITAALVAHVVTDGFMTAEITGSALFWLLMGVGVGLSSSERQRRCPGGQRGGCGLPPTKRRTRR